MLTLFALNSGRSFYLRQITREICENINATRQELNCLESKGLLLSHRDGKQKHFSLNMSLPLIDKLIDFIKAGSENKKGEFTFTDFGRKERLEKNLSLILSSLKQNYKPQKIILFGSLAAGKVGSWSDIDLLIVKETDKPYFDRIREVVSLCNYDVGVDFIIWTPEELEDKYKNNSFFKEEILKNGKVLYEEAA